MKIRLLMGAGLVAGMIGVSGIASSQPDVVKMRQDLMKANDQAIRIASQMIRGQVPYDATAFAGLMNDIGTRTQTFVTLFPESSKATPSKATPAAYTDNGDLKKFGAKMAVDAKAAADGASKGAEAVRPLFGAMAGNCEDCHDKYRND